MDQGQVQAQLAKILASPRFVHAARLSRFLRFVVEAGKGGTKSLKEYRIGVEVFDRGEDFDPRVDPIVRVQAAKLRSKLLEYYTAEGAADPVVISVPKGSYVPDIQARSAAKDVVAAPPSIVARSRIAVLPFVNMSADPENEYFSDGLTEELINRLASVPSLQVVARTSTFRFKGRNEDVREVGARLNAGTIMEGSVRQSGDQLRISAQLIDVQTGYHLFSKTFQRRTKDIFELQDELAQAVVNEIAPDSVAGSCGPGAMAHADNLQAYHAYLKGMFTLSNRLADLKQCVGQFREAIALEPGFAPAWAGLSHAYWLLAWYRQMSSDEAMPQCRDAAIRTLAIDPRSAQGNSSLGIVECGFEWRWESGRARFRRAIELQPGLALIYPFYAVVGLLAQRRLDEACDIVRHGLVLDPFNPLSQAIATFVYLSAGRIDDAIRQQALAAELSPGYPPVVATLATIREWQGHMHEAIDGYRKTIDMIGRLPHLLSYLANALAITGRRDEAERLLRELLALPAPPPLDIARVYVGLRQEDEAFAWLEKAVDQRVIHLLTITTDRRFDSVRDRPRFATITERMGLGGAAT